MRASLKIPAWIFFTFTAITAAFGAWVALALKKGGYEAQDAALTFLFVVTWLGIFGVISIILGAMGIWRSRKLDEHIPIIFGCSFLAQLFILV